MRVNKFVAQATGISRRAADRAIEAGRVKINGSASSIGQEVLNDDQITLDGKDIRLPEKQTTIMLNKPVGYVCSRDGQGSRTIYNLLPEQYHALKSVGRLDKESSGLLLMTDDGELANCLTHPSYEKVKVYEVALNKPLSEQAIKQLASGIKVDDYVSKLKILNIHGLHMQVNLSQGRNRQIRRTFEALQFTVTALNRTAFGEFELGNLGLGMSETVHPHDRYSTKI
jgi:23S rRNA pseudouridine2605 synthase